MATHRLATGRAVGSPVRRQQWSVSARAGDDFRLALTIYDEAGQPAVVRGSRSRLTLVPDVDGPGGGDYGHAFRRSARVASKIEGYLAAHRPGGVNFVLTAAQTAGLDVGRYRLGVHVDLIDGAFTQIEGILQVREFAAAGFGHEVAFFQLDRSRLDGDERLAGEVAGNGLPIDEDGFYVIGAGFTPGGVRPDADYFTSLIGDGRTRHIVLANEPGGSVLGLYSGALFFLAPSDEDTPIVGTANGVHAIVGFDDLPPPVPDPTEIGGLVGADGALLLGWADGAPLLPFEDP